MNIQSYELKIEALPRFVPLESRREEEAAPKRDYSTPRILRRAQLDRETLLRLIEGVRLL